MSWMGDRLANLIAEGQRALGKEVVVMTEGQEDAVDDGSEGWVEDDENGPSSSSHQPSSASHPPSYLGTLRSSKSSRSNLALPIPSPRSATFDQVPTRPNSVNASPAPSIVASRRLGRQSTADSDGFKSVTSSFREDESAWETPEMREMMERARRARQNRA